MIQRAKILIVDDERSIRELLEIVLKKEGFEVTSAPSAEEGLAQVKTTEFDLIVSDINMPDMSGIDLLREVRDEQFQRSIHPAHSLRICRNRHPGPEDGRLRLHHQNRELH